MPSARTPGRWPYRTGKPLRERRVLKARDGSERGVRSRTREPRYRITRLQARVAFAAAVLAMLGSLGWWTYRSPWLTVDEITVTGASQVPAEQVASAAGVDGDSLFGLDLDAAQRRIAALPKVREATVEKRGWNNVTIAIAERTVWGSWQMNGVNVPIDADGYVLDGPPAPEGAPLIVEVEPKRVLNAGDRIDPGAVQLAARLVEEADTAFGRRVLALVYRQTSGLTVVLSGTEADGAPVWATFGDSRDYDYKVAALYVLLERADEADLALTAVDLRFGDRLSFH